MKNLTKSLFTAVAVVAVAGSAAAQTTLKAEIPFAYQAGKAMMAPGTYQVVRLLGGGAPVIQLRNVGERKAVAILTDLGDVSKEWAKAGVPKMAFECVDGSCSLAQIWTGDGRDAIRVRGVRHRRGENAKIELVTIELKAE